MNRTPSPPRRVHTPPAPLHGDNWEPFSPRRSSRVAAQRRLHLEQTDPARTPRTRRDVTPTASSRKPVARTSHFTLSPPSSPTSPPKHRTPHSTRPTLFPAADAPDSDSDSDHPPLTSGRRFLASMAPGMLPTPAKTPRKRALHPQESLQPTARVLFPSRPATIDEVTPRKARRTIKNAYSLESFKQGGESSEKIDIFTDSKERVPTADEDEENPFVTKKGKGKAKAAPQKSRKADAKTAEMVEAVDREEGMIYIFRGRKVFRKFHNGPPSDAPTEEDVEASGDDRQLLRQAGHGARRPLTRSSIKPKLLFQEEIKQKKLENGEVSDEEEEDDDDEKAPTEIEAHIATPSRKKGKTVMHIADSLQEATPPPTARKPKREISFDSWMRVKSSHSSGSSTRGAKRSGSPLVRDVDKKARTRS